MKTMQDVIAKNKALGHHFFSRDTMRYWDSAIESTLRKGKYFITSERKWVLNSDIQGERVYAVREAQPDGSIKTIQSWIETKREAQEFINGLPAEEGHD